MVTDSTFAGNKGGVVASIRTTSERHPDRVAVRWLAEGDSETLREASMHSRTCRLAAAVRVSVPTWRGVKEA
jgi:hypothetical protein